MAFRTQMKIAAKNIATGATSHEYPNLIPTARKIKMYPAATSDAGVRIIRKARFMPHLPILKCGPATNCVIMSEAKDLG